MVNRGNARDGVHCCLFCGRPWTRGVVRKSKEHPLGDWMKKLEDNHPPERRSVSTGMVLDENLKEFHEIPLVITHKKAPLLTLHTREVCKDCNTGWMSDIEEIAKPTILQMARSARSGIAIALDRARAQEVAVWAQETALTYELTSRSPRVGTVAMGQMLREGTPLRGSLVWAARHPRDYEISVGQAQLDVSATFVPRPGPADRRVLMVSIVYHYLNIFVFITDSPGQAGPPLSPVQWILLWPAFGVGQVEFSPMRSVSGTELTEIFTRPGRWIRPVQVSAIRQNGLESEGLLQKLRWGPLDSLAGGAL
jgi:hypothetical protein